jgi:hypothetical protein
MPPQRRLSQRLATPPQTADQCRSNSHHCRPFEDRLDIVTAHAHRQFRQHGGRRFTAQPVTEFAKVGELPTSLPRRVGPAGNTRHSHESTQPYVGRCQGSHNHGPRLGLIGPGTARIAGEIHLNEGFADSSLLSRLVSQGCQQSLAVERVNEVNHLQRPPHFIPLEMADQMPPRCRLDLCKRFRLVPHCLRPALTEINAARGQHTAGCINIAILGHPDDADIIG